MVGIVQEPLRIALIVASTRSAGRFADVALAWLTSRLGGDVRIELDVLDLRDHSLPRYDLAIPPARAFRRYETAEQRAFGERFDAADGFLILVNEFNHGYSAALKDVLDHFFVEFQHKPVALVGYGNVGGARAIEQLRQVAAELDMVSVRETVNILGGEMRTLRSDDVAGRDAVWAGHAPRLQTLVSNLDWWGRALRSARRRMP